MRTGRIGRCSPEGAAAAACTAMPSSLAPFWRTVVEAVADQISGRPRRSGDRTGLRILQSVELHEGTVESIEDAVVLDAHLHGESPACDVVRRNGRSAGVGIVVRMVLRLEHFADHGAKGLCGLH